MYGNLNEMALLATPNHRTRLRPGPPASGPMFRVSSLFRKSAVLVGSLSFVLSITLLVGAPRSAAQDRSDAPTEETVASLAAGRVVIAVVKGAILIGTVENPIEADTRVPVPVALSSLRLGVILGAVRWTSPSTQRDIARLDQELPQLRSRLIAPGPRLLDGQAGGEAGDIETVGQGLLERLSDVARNLHAKVDLPTADPLAELVLVDYLPSYGPEIWQLSYGVKQEEQEPGYWTTRVLRPSYLQFWPPEKGQPRTLVEFAYPRENPPPKLLDLLRQKDPRLEKIVASDAKMTEVANHFLQGESVKALPADATQFLRAALSAVSPPNARQTMAILQQESGFDWILAPESEATQPAYQPPQRPAGAPTLMSPPHY
jgi:hypothetical protein